MTNIIKGIQQSHQILSFSRLMTMTDDDRLPQILSAKKIKTRLGEL